MDEFLFAILSSDESIFGHEGQINRHNEYHYALENPWKATEIFWEKLLHPYLTDEFLG